MARSGRRLSEGERAERRQRDRQRLVEATRELLTSAGWRAWLRTRATFHAYSLHNTCLIALEARCRGFVPTHIAGFRAWLKLGRCVRKGERGLPILAPVKVKERDADGEETGEARTFFRTVYVFDVSQTEPLPGVEPAPLAPPRQPLSGTSHAHLLRSLQRLAGELGYTVSYFRLAHGEGLCDFKARRIAIEATLSANARVATLVHELGHVLIHRDEDQRGTLDKRVEEVVVEAVTYVVLAAGGLDTALDSVPYIASWQGPDALEQVERTAELIDRLARQIEDALGLRAEAESTLMLREAA